MEAKGPAFDMHCSRAVTAFGPLRTFGGVCSRGSRVLRAGQAETVGWAAAFMPVAQAPGMNAAEHPAGPILRQCRHALGNANANVRNGPHATVAPRLT